MELGVLVELGVLGRGVVLLQAGSCSCFPAPGSSGSTISPNRGVSWLGLHAQRPAAGPPPLTLMPELPLMPKTPASSPWRGCRARRRHNNTLRCPPWPPASPHRAQGVPAQGTHRPPWLLGLRQCQPSAAQSCGKGSQGVTSRLGQWARAGGTAPGRGCSGCAAPRAALRRRWGKGLAGSELG